jgi:hypothetical protein
MEMSKLLGVLSDMSMTGISNGISEFVPQDQVQAVLRKLFNG